MLNSTLVPGLAAAVGSLMGAAASIATTWLTQRTQSRRANYEWELREREALFKEFITEASRLTIDALTHSMERPDAIVTLYGILSRIRMVAGQEVLRQGEACCRRIVDQYGQANLTADQLRAAVVANAIDELDPLRAFSNACRAELLAGPG